MRLRRNTMKAIDLKIHFHSELAKAIEQIKETVDTWDNTIFVYNDKVNTNKKELIKDIRADLEIIYKERF
jgi:hypothetical protein